VFQRVHTTYTENLRCVCTIKLKLRVQILSHIVIDNCVYLWRSKTFLSLNMHRRIIWTF
jgi:hypothetical protein